MKKKLLIFALFCVVQVNAQNITFSGEGLTNVKVQNLNSGLIVDVAPGDILTIGGEVGVSEVTLEPSKLSVYPNPSKSNPIILFSPPHKGEAAITLYDLTGKSLIQLNAYLDNSLQEFQLSGLNNGVYIINVRGVGYNLSERVISKGFSSETASISRINNISSLMDTKKGAKDAQTIINLVYAPGDVLKYTAVSGNKTTIMTDVPTENKLVTFLFFECKDGDNNEYPVVKIGDQYWMGEHLRTSKFRNGDNIPTTEEVGMSLIDEVDPIYQWPSNGVSENISDRGRVYTWFAAINEKNVCPSGWHLPSKEEFDALGSFLAIEVGNKLKDAGSTWWAEGNTGNNFSGFSARAAGNRHQNGTFEQYPTRVNFLTSTPSGEDKPTQCVIKRLDNSSNALTNINTTKKHGHSIRCIKD